MPAENRLTAKQRHNNAASRRHRDEAGPHREQVTRLLLNQASAGSPSLCVLGAGNTNDLDLPTILAAYERVDLVDLDERAVRRGVASQSVPADAVGVLAPRDVTGVWDALASLADRPDDHQAIDQLIVDAASTESARLAPTPGDGYTTVASTCLLSQLIESAVATLGPSHERLAELVLALRDAHLCLVTQLVSPGGAGLLVIDFTSSNTAPSLPDCPTDRLPQFLHSLINEGNFFSGLNPFRICEVLRESAEPWGIVRESIEVTEPWRWRMGDLVFAVTAVTFQKTDAG